MKKLPKVDVKCLWCNKCRLVLQSYINRGGGKYCNKICSGKAKYEKNKDKFNYDRHGENHPMYGKTHSQSAKNKMSAAHKGKRLGEDNNKWKGEDVSYGGLHDYIESKLGKPQKCDRCGTIEYHRYEWANRSRTYTRDLTDWIRLCVPCHRKVDYYQLPL